MPFALEGLRYDARRDTVLDADPTDLVGLGVTPARPVNVLAKPVEIVARVVWRLSLQHVHVARYDPPPAQPAEPIDCAGDELRSGC